MNLRDIKGFGDKRIEKLAACGIYDPLDLLMLFPHTYYDRRVRPDWDGLPEGGEVIFRGTVTGRPVFRRVRRGLSFVKAVFLSDGREITCTWFNQDYVFRQLVVGAEKLILGRIKRYGRRVEVTAPQLLTMRDTDVMPVYRLPRGITQTVMLEAVGAILRGVKIKGYISSELAEEYGLLPLAAAFRAVHMPQSLSEAERARQSIALENLVYTLSAYNLVKNTGEAARTNKYLRKETELAAAADSLPFRLTADQKKAVTDIVNMLHSDRRANVLLQGDVGSGKTAVAFLAMYYAVLSGYQVALMAPTEILARQHFAKASDFFGRLGVKAGLLVGSLKKTERAAVLGGLKSGEISVAVGTHALISGDVIYRNLALTVTDEQHRFGVCQRGSLENKAAGADNIVVSATPIPRTLALTLYGQLDSVVLSERPAGKNNTLTATVPENKLDDMYKYIADKAAAGEKTYIVCPRVDSEDSVSAVSLYKELSRGPLSGAGVRLLHGRMSESEKDKAMREFADGDASVLVCTTVIEVGIDVKSATTMVIFGADRFGLSQLHQLRGRIGRDGRQSWCFIVQSGEPSERIKFLCGCSDGFRLAEYDFDARGAGDFLGTRQHGSSSAFAGVRVDAAMIAQAKRISDRLLADPAAKSAIAAGAEGRSEFIRSLSLN